MFQNILHPKPSTADALATVTDAQFYLADSHRFVSALNLGFATTDLREVDVAHAAGVSTSTVQRWRMGHSLPYGNARRPILKLIFDKLISADGQE